jgi:hypothetical protein
VIHRLHEFGRGHRGHPAQWPNVALMAAERPHDVPLRLHKPEVRSQSMTYPRSRAAQRTVNSRPFRLSALHYFAQRLSLILRFPTVLLPA